MGDQERTNSLRHSSSMREDENLSARRAATESVEIARETLEITERQKEQLENTRDLADETEYKLEKASRILRGMTWMGWIANKFSKDAEPPNLASRPEETLPKLQVPKVYEDVPRAYEALASAIQNYHANLCVLESSGTEEQKETLNAICDNMYRKAAKELNSTPTPDDIMKKKNFLQLRRRFEKDLAALRERQFAISSCLYNDQMKELVKETTPRLHPGNRGNDEHISEELHQEEHLEFLQYHLSELHSLASNLGNSIAGQNDILTELDGKNDNLLYKTKSVTRRADNLIQKKVRIGCVNM
jgi:hypothetical protein